MKTLFSIIITSILFIFIAVPPVQAGIEICEVNPATGECYGQLIPHYETLVMGECLNCGDGIIKGNKMNVVFDHGSIRGIWGTGGTTILTIETDTGKKIQFDTHPNGATLKINNPNLVAIWGTGGTTREITDYIEQDDMKAIWGTGGTTIWGTGGTTISKWGIDNEPVFSMYTGGGGDLHVSINIDERARVLVSPEPPPFE